MELAVQTRQTRQPCKRGVPVIALIAAVGATLVEAISPWGIDNLTVPAVSAIILALAR